MGSLARPALLVLAFAVALLAAACTPKDQGGGVASPGPQQTQGGEQQGGEIEAVNLIGAWVDAGAKENEPFTFKGKDGKEYKATFKDDILPLFTTPNIWAPNTPACNSCHTGVSESSAHQMGLGSYADIMKGGDCLSGECVPIVNPGDWKNSKLRARLRDNRMPPGMPFLLDESNRDGPVYKTKSGGETEAVNLIGAWVDAGAKENEPFTFKGKDGKEYKATFKDDILPLFTTPNIWAPNTPACNSCHTGISESSAHQMGLGSYADIMKGADCLSGECVPIIKPGDWKNSKLRARLRDNRMPPGMPFLLDESNRDGPVVRAGTPTGN